MVLQLTHLERLVVGLSWQQPLVEKIDWAVVAQGVAMFSTQAIKANLVEGAVVLVMAKEAQEKQAVRRYSVLAEVAAVDE